MKRTKHLLTFYRVCYSAGLLLLVGYLASFMPVVRAVTSPDGALGWSWNAFQPKNSTTLKVGLGWSSLSCLNDFDNDGELENQCDISVTPRPYGLSIALGADGTLNGTNDYVQGCAWSSAYGWICFNGGTGSTYQCDESQLTNPDGACADLSTTGVAIKNFNNYFYYLDSPAYSSWNATPPASQRATILSLWSSTDKAKSYIGFPTEPGNLTLASTTNDTTEGNKLFGCFGCTVTSGTSGTCNACLNVSTENEDSYPGPATNPNPNLLAWNCSDCTITDPDGGSCSQNRDKNSCKALSCARLSAYTGVVVNQYPKDSGQYEMCGWGWNAYSDPATVKNQYSLVDASHDEDGRLAIDMDLDVDGLPVLTYMSKSSGVKAVRIARCGDPSCTIQKKVLVMDNLGSNNEISTPRISVNPTTDPALASYKNVPFVTYGYDTGTDVRVGYCTDASCETAEERILFTNGGLGCTFRISSAIGADGKPAILYYVTGSCIIDGVNNSSNMDFIKCNDPRCVTRTSSKKIGGDGIGGFYNDIEMPPGSNNPVMVYGKDLLYYLAKCNDATCASVSGPYTLPALSGNISNIDLELVDANTAFVSYFISSGGANIGYYLQKINISACSGSSCSSLSPAIIIASAASGDGASSIALGADGLVTYSYTLNSPTNSLYVVRCNDANCTTRTVSTVPKPTNQTIDSQDAVVVTSDDFPSLAYYNSAAGNLDLRFMKCNSRDCTTARSRGLGWLAFNPQRIGDTTYVYGEGNIFSGGSITSPVGPPATRYNSAYIIEASGEIRNWFSSRQYSYNQRGIVSPYLTKGVGQPEVYQSIFGKLDYKGIVTDVVTGVEVSSSNTSGTNKYGGRLWYRSPADDHGLIDANALDNRALYWKATVANPLITINAFTVPCQPGTNGAGIIVVDGNLQINGNIDYGSCSPTASKLRDIPSLVWIVRGDVTIGSAVTDIAGTFIVLGNGNPGKTTCPSLPTTASNGCGWFNTGASDSRFTSQGAVLARSFNFQRTRSASAGPAETFIADGRLQANTPAGLSDLAKSLPRFSGRF